MPVSDAVRALLRGGLPGLRAWRAAQISPHGDVAAYVTGENPAPPSFRVSKEFHTSEHVLRQHQRADWNGVAPDMRAFAGAMILEARKHGVSLYANNAKRTPEEQRALFDKGVSRNPGPEAPHVRGYAVDIVDTVRHWDLEPDEWKFLGVIGYRVADRLGLAITWGGAPQFGFYDPAHWQATLWRGAPHVEPGNSPLRLTPHALKAYAR